MNLRNRHLLWLSGVCALALVVLAAVTVTAGSSSAPERSTKLPVFRLDADHATYPALPDVVGDAGVIVTGEVISHSTEPGESPGVDALGDPLPAVPHTNYSVLIKTVLKGSASPGDVIVVSLSGGISASGEFVLDGAPEIHDGDVAMFFLEGASGKFYPLAGGAAVAGQSGDESFVLPPDATGQGSLSVTEGAVKAATATAPVAQPPTQGSPAGSGASTPTPAPTSKHCKAGFKKKKVKHRIKCVKVKKGKKKHHHHRHHHS